MATFRGLVNEPSEGLADEIVTDGFLTSTEIKPLLVEIRLALQSEPVLKVAVALAFLEVALQRRRHAGMMATPGAPVDPRKPKKSFAELWAWFSKLSPDVKQQKLQEVFDRWPSTGG